MPFSRAAAQWLKQHSNARTSSVNTDLDNHFLAACGWRTHIGDVRVDAFEVERSKEGWDGGDDGPVRVVIVPGNPGVCSFYVRFTKMVYNALGREASVTCISYKGFLSDPREAMLVTLAEERQYFISLLNAIHKRSPNERIVLVGHSIGAWLCTEAMKAMPCIPVADAALIFPFNCVGRDKMRRQNWLDTRTWPAVVQPFLEMAFSLAGRAGFFFRILPDFQQRMLLRMLGGDAAADDLCAEVTLEYLAKRPHILRSIFFLGQTEVLLVGVVGLIM